MNASSRSLRLACILAVVLIGASCGQYYGVHARAAQDAKATAEASGKGLNGSSNATASPPDIAGDDGANGPGPNAITGNSSSALPRTIASPGKGKAGSGPGSGGRSTGNGKGSGGNGGKSGTQPAYRVPTSVEAVLRAGPNYTGRVLPAGFPFVICPVQGQYSFSDDYGAPRYAGGYHPHAGNDVFATLGTPIVAPFDGSVVQDPNTLGGLAVKVTGPLGYVYMAHLVDYAPTVPGRVRAGDVVGFVGNTGDAQGTSPHDHFEWHPNVVHSYDKQIPDTNGAVDPFPYLRVVCPPG